jgi:O-antigen ligase
MIQNQPIIGVGLGNWRIQYPVHAKGRMLDAKTVPHRPHNDLLEIWSESGIGALLMYFLLLFYSFRTAWRSASGPDRAIVVAIAASLAACVTNSLFSFPKEFVAASAPLWFGMGALVVLGKDQSSRAVV